MHLYMHSPSHIPLIKQGPLNTTVELGGRAKFTCHIHNSSHRDLQLLWVKQHLINGSYEDESGTPHTTVLKHSTNLTNMPWTLVLENVTEENKGWYSCVVINEVRWKGWEYEQAYLNVLIDEDKEEELRTGMSTGFSEDNPTLLIIGTISGFIVLLLAVSITSLCLWYSYKRKELTMSRFKIYQSKVSGLTFLGQIGEGAFGVVEQATAYGIGKVPKASTVAVKRLRETATAIEQQDFVGELQMMKSVKKMGHHINIVNFLGCCTVGGPLLMIVEFAKNGNLRDFLESCRDGINGYGKFVPTQDPGWYTKTPDGQIVNRKNLISFAFQIARGMEFLASRKCIHRDLAARNVLVTEEHVLKIADFGLTRSGDYYKKKAGQIASMISFTITKCAYNLKVKSRQIPETFGQSSVGVTEWAFSLN
nr:hypothetical protein BaRGS_013619 [Batillaria attramentaria]